MEKATLDSHKGIVLCKDTWKLDSAHGTEVNGTRSELKTGKRREEQ
jgi:hypothetical protein